MSSTTYPLGGSAEEHAAALLSADDLANRLRDIAPDMGCYLIEAHTREPDYQEAFWGDHYGRLVNIKRRVDLSDIFWCPVQFVQLSRTGYSASCSKESRNVCVHARQVAVNMDVARIRRKSNRIGHSDHTIGLG